VCHADTSHDSDYYESNRRRDAGKTQTTPAALIAVMSAIGAPIFLFVAMTDFLLRAPDV